MPTARFTTEIGPDLTIRLPADSGLTPGLAEVTVVQAAALRRLPRRQNLCPPMTSFQPACQRLCDGS